MIYTESVDVLAKFGLKLLGCTNVQTRSLGVKFLEHIRKNIYNEKELVKCLGEEFIKTIFNDSHEKILNDCENLISMILRKSSQSKELLTLIISALLDCRSKTAFKAVFGVVEELLGKHEEQMLEILKKDLSKHRDTTAIEPPGMFFASTETKLDFLWYLIFDQNIPFRNEVLPTFTLLLNRNTKFKSKYIGGLGDKFGSNEDIGVSMRILLEIDFTETLTRSALITFLSEKQIIKNCIESCKAFHTTAKGLALKDGSVVMPETGLTLIEQAGLYLKFLHRVCFVDKAFKLDDSDIDTLWTLYIREAFSPECENIFWTALRRENAKRYLGFSYTLEELDQFFTDYLTNENELPAERMTINAFECFKEYAKLLSGKSKKKEDVGVEFLWSAVLRTNDFALEKAMTDYIVEMFYEEVYKNPKKSTEILENFLHQILVREHKLPKETRTSLAILKRLTTT